MTTMVEAKTLQVYQVFIKADPLRIWDAITKPEFTQRYFHGTRADHELRAGGAYRSLAGDGDGVLVVDGEVLEVDPPRRFVHTWHALYDPELGAEEPSRVTWEIEAQDGGISLVTVTHDRLEGAPKTAESVSGAGWMMVLSGLKTLLETGEPLA
jgi:uncharacterized protein YndB with AHSA1/START domain